MRKLIPWTLVAALTLAGCAGSTKVAVPVPTDKIPPPVVSCDLEGAAKCFGDCPLLPEWKLTLDRLGLPFGDFDELQAIAIEDEKIRAECEAKLRACQACLVRLHEEGVIRLEARE